jgi:hypothetical protein
MKFGASPFRRFAEAASRGSRMALLFARLSTSGSLQHAEFVD